MQHWSCKPEASQPDLWWWSYSSGLLLRGWSWTACPQSSQNNKQHSFEPFLYLDQCSQLTKPLWFDTWLKRVEMVHASWHALRRRRKKCAGGQWFTKRSPQPSHVKKIATTAITGRFSINMWNWLRTSAIVASANYALSPKYHDTLYMTLHGQSQIKPVSKWRWQSVTYTLHLKIGTGLKTTTKQIQASSLNKETKGQALQASVQLTASNPYSADSKICPKSCNFWEPNSAHMMGPVMLARLPGWLQGPVFALGNPGMDVVSRAQLNSGVVLSTAHIPSAHHLLCETPSHCLKEQQADSASGAMMMSNIWSCPDSRCVDRSMQHWPKHRPGLACKLPQYVCWLFSLYMINAGQQKMCSNLSNVPVHFISRY